MDEGDSAAFLLHAELFALEFVEKQRNHNHRGCILR